MADKRVPSPEYQERVRREVLDDPETQREIAEFRAFLASVRSESQPTTEDE